jgi:isopentenyl-diphosphate Delta-isomerase
MPETISQFEGRKRDHIALALKNETEALGQSGLDDIELIHEALPDLVFSEINLSTKSLNEQIATPFVVSSMTAGHDDSLTLNTRLAKVSAERGWWMGVGSQRRELTDTSALQEWKAVRAGAPRANLMSNIGIAQLIVTPIEQVMRLTEAIEARAMIVHLNALQECIQPEGTPSFKGGLEKISALVKALAPLPVIVKETGCGFSARTLLRLKETGIAVVDVAGFGGTHWGRIEGLRATTDKVRAAAGQTFANWGISTADAVLNAKAVNTSYEVWGSGGVRTGLDAAKLLALGTKRVAFAKPILQAALDGDESLNLCMQTIEFELQTALFCTGCKSIEELSTRKVWQWHHARHQTHINPTTK